MTVNPSRGIALEGLDQPVTRLDATSQVARRLLAHVSAGTIQPGERLPSERQLAADMHVGRSAVREAVAALSLLGIIEVRQGSGNYVVADSSELLPQAITWGLMLGRPNMQEIVEIRGSLEVVAAKLAARNITTAQAPNLASHVEMMAATLDDREAFARADAAFHAELATIASNSVLSDVLRTIAALLEVWIRRAMLTSDDDHPASALKEHRAIYDAVAAHDEDLAQAAMTNHMRQAGRRLWESLDESQPFEPELIV